MAGGLIPSSPGERAAGQHQTGLSHQTWLRLTQQRRKEDRARRALCRHLAELRGCRCVCVPMSVRDTHIPERLHVAGCVYAHLAAGTFAVSAAWPCRPGLSPGTQARPIHLTMCAHGPSVCQQGVHVRASMGNLQVGGLVLDQLASLGDTVSLTSQHTPGALARLPCSPVPSSKPGRAQGCGGSEEGASKHP